MFSVTLEDAGEVVVLHCQGSLVKGQETGVLCAAVKHHGREIVLDLGKVSTIDAAGIGALISLQTAGIYLRLENPTKAVRDVLRLTGMDSVFEISEPGEPLRKFAREDVESKMTAAPLG